MPHQGGFGIQLYFSGAFFISECSFFGFFVSVTTKITVQRSECGLHSYEKDCVFQVCRFYQLFGAILATSDMLQRDDVVHCFCLRSRGCFLSKQREG